MDIPIIFQDQDIVIISKPAGVVVNRATSVRGETLQDWFEEHILDQKKGIEQVAAATESWQELVPADFDTTYGTPEEIFKERSGMVHRLDKDTSGIMVFAKNPGALVNLLAQFRDREVSKKYVCLVHGKVQPDRDIVSAPLGRAQGKNRKKFQVRPDGRPAETEYQVLNFWPGFSENAQANLPKNVTTHPTYQQGFTLVEATPHTGRTHQIRVHFAHLGHPLVGDATYTGKKRAGVDSMWCPRHFLHASELSILHPRSNQKQTFESDLETDTAAADLSACLHNCLLPK